MAVLPILRWPDARLSQVCKPVDRLDDNLRTLAADMFQTLYASQGRGLAAPQVGVLSRLFIMDETWKEGRAQPRVFVNPVITERSDTCVMSAEGCLSIPGPLVPVRRSDAIRMAWTDLAGNFHHERLEGFVAICAQHEADHLDGRLTLDHLATEDRPRFEAEVTP
jgi:peptide deformylase